MENAGILSDGRPWQFKATLRLDCLKICSEDLHNDKRFHGNVCGNIKRNHFAKPIVVGVGDIDSNSEILAYHNHVYYVEMARR